jgi:hypothetical protein
MKLSTRFWSSTAIYPQTMFFRTVTPCRINILVISKEPVASIFRVTESDLCGCSNGAVTQNRLILMKGNS